MWPPPRGARYGAESRLSTTKKSERSTIQRHRTKQKGNTDRTATEESDGEGEDGGNHDVRVVDVMR